MFLNISHTLDIEGTLSANGDNFRGGSSGGGSGGSILVRTQLFEGSGTVQVCMCFFIFFCIHPKLKRGPKTVYHLIQRCLFSVQKA